MELRDKLHKFVDDWMDKQEKPVSSTTNTASGPPVVAPPEDTMVVRTPTTLDKVYLLDKTKNTRQWVSTPEALKELGFELIDVKEITDAEFNKYMSAPAIYRTPDSK